MTQDDFNSTSTDAPSRQNTLLGETWWDKVTRVSDPSNSTPSQKEQREKALAETHRAILEVEQGLPNSTGILVRR